MAKKSTLNAYDRIVEAIFKDKYREGATEVAFSRDDLAETAERLGIPRPKNLGDIVYSYKNRTWLPESIRKTEPEEKSWVIINRGTAQYCFELRKDITFKPNEALAITKVPDATPAIVTMYALSDEQALLTKLRYSRMLDIFTGIACYSLQNHLRTSVPNRGQVETDELYVGVDKKGAQYVLPVQAKGGKDRLGVTQIEQDIALCAHKFPNLICRPIAAQFMADGAIALFEFEESAGEVRILNERHYCLVSPSELSAAEIQTYNRRPDTF